MRIINDIFIEDLLTGPLEFFLNQVKANRSELSLEIRNGYVNIYYKGGNLLRITQKRKGYSFYFDARYCLNKGDDSRYHLFQNLSNNDVDQYIQYFDLMKQEMDSWFVKHPKEERDFQHKLLVSNPCIIDIEYQIRNIMRLDMLIVSDNTLYIVENKYGIGAIGGKSGIRDHYEKICQMLSTPELYDELLDSACSVSQAKMKLGLSDKMVHREDICGAEILFLFGNYNPKSTSITKSVNCMEKQFPAKILMMDKDEQKIDLSKMKDMFEYGN